MKTDNLIDLGLVDSYLQGNQEAFNLLMQRNKDYVQSVVYQTIQPSPEDLEDLCQNIWLSVYTKVHSWKRKAAFKSWLFRVAANAALMHVRKKTIPTVSLSEEIPFPDSTSTAMLWGDIIADPKIDIEKDYYIKEALNKLTKDLPKHYKEIVQLKKKDYNLQEIKTELGTSIGSIKGKFSRAKKFLNKKGLIEAVR